MSSLRFCYGGHEVNQDAEGSVGRSPRGFLSGTNLDLATSIYDTEMVIESLRRDFWGDYADFVYALF